MEIQGHAKYLIYPDGRVWSKIGKGKWLKLSDNGNGYLKCALGKKSMNNYIHHLVATHYIPNPQNLPVIDHINRNKKDNRVENLRWVTQKDNCNNSSVRCDNSTGFVNISFHNKYNQYRYVSYICGKKYDRSELRLEFDAIYKLWTLFAKRTLYDYDINGESVHWMPQNVLVECDGEVFVDFIGKYENLENDWKKISNKLKVSDVLPRVPVAPVKKGTALPK